VSQQSVKIFVETVPHESQRYPTVGDWVWEEDTLHIKVSDIGNWKYEVLVGLHEAIEALLCRDRNIAEKDVSDFDIAYEKSRREGNVGEPGDDTGAPYHKEHFFATSIERLIASELGLEWGAYDAAIENLPDIPVVEHGESVPEENREESREN
jgi:hypothetical protein